MRVTWRWTRTVLLATSLCLPMWASDATVHATAREMPNYPVLLRGLKIGGKVKLRLTVSPDGKVQQATIEGGNPMLAELSCIAARKWKFTEGAGTSKVA